MAVLVKEIIENKKQELDKIPAARLSRAQKIIKIVDQKHTLYKKAKLFNVGYEIIEFKDKNGITIAIEGPSLNVIPLNYKYLNKLRR